MKKFSIEEAKKLSRDQIQAIICDGLGEVAERLSRESDSKRELVSLSQEFHSLARFLRTKGTEKK